MAKTRLKLKALELRKKGMSYSQIKRRIGVSKSTLSVWLRDYPLSEERVRELRDWNEKRIEKFRETMRRKREKRYRAVYKKERFDLVPLSKKELYIAGLFLYWGEGGKTARAQITMSNTDPRLLRFYLKWLDVLGVRRRDVKVKLHIYKDMNESDEMDYWSKTLEISKEQFDASYVKKTTLKGLTYKTRGHGTCNVVVYGRDLYEKVMLGIQAVVGEYEGLG